MKNLARSFAIVLIVVLIFQVLIFRLQANATVIDASTFTITILPGPQCYDGQDNDGDGQIDYPDDPGCSSVIDDDEADPVYCGDDNCSDDESCSSCPADCGVCPTGGGGGLTIQPTTSASFRGQAYPQSTVTLLKDAQIAGTSIADSDANFEINLTGLSAGNYTFSLYSEDYRGQRSSLVTLPLTITKGSTTYVIGIFIPPTIAVDKEKVKKGDKITIFGQSASQTEITIIVNSNEEQFAKTDTDDDGAYLYDFDSSSLEYGDHFTKSKAAKDGLVSSFSRVISFKVGTENIPSSPPQECIQADLNCDKLVNLIDFSIAAYWYERPLSADFSQREADRLNGDGQINLLDFSIIAYYWTG